MNSELADRVIQLALLFAGDSDEFRDRELGPIHLLKYVYLADLSHAREKGGAIYTGAVWRFHKFGPWDYAILERIEPALEAVQAKKTVHSHPMYEDDFVRWSLRDDDLMREIEHSLPLPVVFGLKAAVREFGSDTAALLDHVYRTGPMLKAAPGEVLIFSAPDIEHGSVDNVQNDISLPSKSVDIKKLRAEMRIKLSSIKEGGIIAEPEPPPRYDEVFEKGTAWLDDLAGKRIEENEFRVEISEECWKSKSRYDPELP